MKRLYSISFLLILALSFGGCALLQPLQKSQIISVFHLIETAKYNEAKGVVDEMINNEESAEWARVWYARGLLSQTAYREGIKKNDKKLYELYPEQLYVAFDSYERAVELDKRGRLEKQLKPNYVLLVNDLQSLGEREFKAGKYPEALKAFEHALCITDLVDQSKDQDTALVYNAALAAYEGDNWAKAKEHLGRLHSIRYSVNVTHLFFNAQLNAGDTLAAQRALEEGIDFFEEDEILVLLLADLQVRLGEPDQAIGVLDAAIARSPENAVYHNTKGLIYQKNEAYQDAITAYEQAIALDPDDLMAFLNIATSYYNIGVEIEEGTLTMTNIYLVQREKEKSALALESAVEWLDKVYEKEPTDPEVRNRMYELYRVLRINEKVISLED
ncbi:MAG: tetratricopeptide repeat protein [Bacteroidales bacterium]|jgi:tetratricopeptide (TPR) repeat protein|nr:tetratricopeptide repeat protein [Bacteroidales bacterium]NLM91467.1 tetratricopeptide repeat protein [Bacteroidales bacterium]